MVRSRYDDAEENHFSVESVHIEKSLVVDTIDPIESRFQPMEREGTIEDYGKPEAKNE